MAQARPSMTRFYLLLVAVAVAGGGALWWVVRGSAPKSIPANIVVSAADTAGFRGYLLGSDTAPVEITEFGDYQCPACGQFEQMQFPTVRAQLVETGRIRWRYMDFPLDNIHQWARLAAHAAACADEQGHYWPMHELLFRNQAVWSNDSRAGSLFRDYAGQVGVDLGQYDGCMNDIKYAGRIQAMAEQGIRTGVNATPTLLIGGRLYNYIGSDQIKALVDSLEQAATP